MVEKYLVRNAADPEQVEKAKEKVETRDEQKINDIREVLGTRRGRRYFWGLLEWCGIFKTSNSDEHQIFFNEGMRNVGLKLLADVNEAAPEVYNLMLRESKEE